jgi:hypothetical protein
MNERQPLPVLVQAFGAVPLLLAFTAFWAAFSASSPAWKSAVRRSIVSQLDSNHCRITGAETSSAAAAKGKDPTSSRHQSGGLLDRSRLRSHLFGIGASATWAAPCFRSNSCQRRRRPSRLWNKSAAARCGDWQPWKPLVFSGVAQVEKGRGGLFSRTARPPASR